MHRGKLKETPSMEKGFRPLSLTKITKFVDQKTAKQLWLHCNHILFTLPVSNFLSAKHQTLLKIAYLFRRLACLRRGIEKHPLSKKASGFYPLRKYQNFFKKELLKSCLHCDTFYLLFL